MQPFHATLQKFFARTFAEEIRRLPRDNLPLSPSNTSGNLALGRNFDSGLTSLNIGSMADVHSMGNGITLSDNIDSVPAKGRRKNSVASEANGAYVLPHIRPATDSAAVAAQKRSNRFSTALADSALSIHSPTSPTASKALPPVLQENGFAVPVNGVKGSDKMKRSNSMSVGDLSASLRFSC